MFWVVYILKWLEAIQTLPQYVSPVKFSNLQAWEQKMPPSDTLRQGHGKQICFTASKYLCLLSLPSVVHTHQRQVTHPSKVSPIEPQVAKSWAGAGEETGNQTASHLLWLQRSKSVSATYCLGARMVSESPPSPTRLPVRQGHHADSRRKTSATLYHDFLLLLLLVPSSANQKLSLLENTSVFWGEGAVSVNFLKLSQGKTKWRMEFWNAESFCFAWEYLKIKNNRS